MDPRVLMRFSSHIDGKNAAVEIYADRIEWSRSGGASATRIAAGALTMGASLLATGVRKGGGAEMLPIKAITSVTTQKDGMRFYRVLVTAAGTALAFRTDRTQAEQAKVILTSLILGTHPAQRANDPEPSSPMPAPASAASTPAAAPAKVEQLTQLAALRDSGILTEAEFAAEKARILAS